MTDSDRNEIDKLLVYLPILSATGFRPVDSWSDNKNSKGVSTWPYPTYNENVRALVDAISHEFWADTSYVEKNPGALIGRAGYVAAASLDQLKTLLTFVVRGERFCTGHIEGQIEAGHVEAILRRLAVLRAAA